MQRGVGIAVDEGQREQRRQNAGGQQSHRRTSHSTVPYTIDRSDREAWTAAVDAIITT
jgi:hypothetical protein